ncbi:hypothetical protein J7J74_02480 [bacterium]|nr:hypothetical protein [bacterium]
MDVNEQIAKAYFEEVCSYVVKTNHYFKKKGKRGGAGPADIDLILIHPQKGYKEYGKYAICTVKGWQSYKVSINDIKNQKKFEEEWKIFEKQELEAAKRFFGVDKFSKILILPPINSKHKKEAINYCKKRYNIILLDFSDVLFELIEYLSKDNRMYRSFQTESLQTLRIILVNLLQIKDSVLILQPNILEHLQINKNQNNIEFKSKKLFIKK